MPGSLGFLILSLGVVNGASECRDPSISTCGECFARGPDCAWCSDPPTDKDFTGSRIRCGTEKELVDDKCKRDNIEFVESKIETQSGCLPINDPTRCYNEGFGAIKPSNAPGQIRMGGMINYTVEFTRPEYFPVDMYYLIDLSGSMKDDLDNLKKLGQDISDTMKNETGSTDGQQNFRFGFGSFVDRPMAPFINPLKKENPCNEAEPCDPTYTFLNNQKITANYQTVERALQSTSTSSNIDMPEDGLTAMIQSIECNNDIGWRSTNFKILIFSSDAPVKVAGDGIVAGLIEPNDGQCHMDSNRYTKELEYDYPSIGRVLKVIREAEVAVILAVTKENHAFYENFRDEINKIGKAELGELSEDSDNVVDLIRDEYKKLIEHIKFQNENLPEELKLTVVSECEPGVDTNEPSCDGVQANQSVKFKVQLEMKKVDLERCQEIKAQLKSKKPRFSIFGMSGGTGDKTGAELDLDLVCDCNCGVKNDNLDFSLEVPKQYRNHYGVDSFECKNGGVYTCGVCQCPPEWSGLMCQCDSDSIADTQSCYNPDDPHEVCSGRGICDCDGTCKCFFEEGRVINGTYCEHDPNLCPKDDQGLVCGGHGTCTKDYMCECYTGWVGQACDCEDSTNQCVTDGDLCHGNGQCKCNQCKCDTFDTGFFTQSDKCETFKSGCEQHAPCAQCSYYGFLNGGPMKVPESVDPVLDCSQCEGKYHDIKNGELNNHKDHQVSSVKDSGRYLACSTRIFVDEAQCTLNFGIKSNRGLYENMVEKALINIIFEPHSCPKAVNLYVVFGTIFGILFLIGLLILLFIIIFIRCYRKRELERHQKRVQGQNQSEFRMNPLHQSGNANYTVGRQ